LNLCMAPDDATWPFAGIAFWYLNVRFVAINGHPMSTLLVFGGNRYCALGFLYTKKDKRNPAFRETGLKPVSGE
jgi:hypothetical protein